MTSLQVLDRRAAIRAERKPVAYRLTHAGRAVLDEHGPFCPEWIPGGRLPKPCLLPAGHHGACDPDGRTRPPLR